MKSTAILFLIQLTFFVNLWGQKSFEGFVNYDINYLSLPPELQGMESSLPASITKYFSGSKMRTEQELPSMGKQIMILDFEEQTGAVLMDLMGMKTAIPFEEEDFKNMYSNAEKTKISKKSGTKEIAGYKCKRIVIEREDLEAPVTMWYSKEWDTPEIEYGDIQGIPLEITVVLQGMQMTMTATTVSRESVEPSMFEVPEEYQESSLDEMMEQFGN